MFYNPPYSAIGEAAATVRDDVRKRVHAKFEEAAYKLRYFMTEEDFQYLADALAPRPISYDSKNALVDHTHPVAAELQNVAYQKCYDVAQKFTNAIDIGGSLYRSGKGHHICSSIKDCRDAARRMNAMLDIKPSLLNCDKALCREGAENCNYQAAYAYSVNVYDIPFDNIPYIMEKHGIRRWDMWLFLPLNLLDSRMMCDQTFFTNIIYRDDKGHRKCRFSLRDSSNAYVHDYKNWKKFFTVTAMRSRWYTYNLEHIDQKGPLVCVRITQTTGHIEPVYREIDLGPHKKLCMVPDLMFYFTVLRAAGDMWTRCIWVEDRFVNNVRKWSMRQGDNLFNYANFAAYFDGISTNIYYMVDKQQKLVYRGVNVNSEEYKRLQISLFIICAIDRFERTQTVGSMFNFLKRCDGGLFDTIIHEIRVWWRSTVNTIGAWVDDKDLDIYLQELETKSDTYFRDARVKYPDRIVCSDVLIGRSCRLNKRMVIPSKHVIASVTPHNELDEDETTIKKPKTEAEEPETKDTNWECGLTVTHNPKGDGECGLHCIRWFCQQNGGRAVIPADAIINGTRRVFPTTMHDADDLGYICKVNKINLVVHHVMSSKQAKITSPKLTYMWDSSWPTLKLLNSGAHWQVVKCDCPDDIYVGRYAELQLCEDYLYVNCANHQLGDGGGQAADFRLMFGDYDKNIVKPVPNVSFTKRGDIHLCLAVALDAAADASKVNQYKRIKEITDAIEAYCIKHDLTVYMPMIGTAIYGNDLCCVKKLVNAMNCKKVITLFNNKSLSDYRKTLPCTHAGYIDVGSGDPVTLVRGKYDKRYYNRILYNNDAGKMEKKYKDIEAKVNDIGYDEIVELSAAPGAFACVADKKLKYTGYHYTKGDFMLRRDAGIPAERHWDNYDALPKFKDVCVLLDYHAPPGSPFYDRMQGWVEDGCIVISKICVYRAEHEEDTADEAMVLNNLPNCRIEMFRNEASQDTSSELYYVASSGNGRRPKTIDINDVQTDIDKGVLKHQHNQKCKCVAEVAPNAKLSWKNSQEQFALFKKHLLDECKGYDFADEDFGAIVENASLCIESIDALLGVAGSGKSRGVVKSTCGLCSILIAPMRSVVKQHGKVIDYGVDSRAATFVKAISVLADKQREIKYVFVDEVFLVNPYFLSIYKSLRPDAKFFALGDPYQIKADFSQTAPEYTIQKLGDYVVKSERVPWCLEKMLKRYVPDIICNRGKTNRMFVEDDITKQKFLKTDVIICHTQEMKGSLKNTGAKVYTAHEAMGCTFNKVHVYTGDIGKIRKDKAAYVYVAMTRTAGDIVFYGSKSQIEEYFTVLGSPLERAAESPITNAVPTADVKITEETTREVTEEPRRALSTETYNIDAVVDILSNIYPKKNEHIERRTLQKRVKLLPEIMEPTATVKINPELLHQCDVKVNGRMMVPNRLFNQTYHGKDMFGKVSTAIKRYAGKRKFIPKLHKAAVTKIHVEGLKKFLKPEREWSKFKVSQTDVMDNVFKYFRNLQKKFGKSISELKAVELAESEFKYYQKVLMDGKAKDKFTDFVAEYVRQLNGGFDDPAGLENMFVDAVNDFISDADNGIDKNKNQQIRMEWHDPRNQYVDFHMKSQPKEIRKLFWDTYDKAGQGISAYGKMHNILLCAIQTTLHDWIRHNMSRNCMLAADASDEEIAQKFIKMGATQAIYDENLKVFVCDATEFDSTQLEMGIEAVCIAAEFAGCPKMSVDFYRNVRQHWDAMTTDQVAGLVAHMRFTCKYFMTSGSLMTLTGNTVYNMSMIGGCYEFKDLAFAAFKGDDSIIVAQSIKPANYFGMKVADFCGYKLKDEYPRVPEFIANFVTPFGFFPDVLRRASRVCSRVVTHPDQWYEIRKSLADALAVIQSPDALEIGCQMAAIAYQDMGISINTDQVRILATFLHQAANFHELTTEAQGNWEIIYFELEKIRHELNVFEQLL